MKQKLGLKIQLVMSHVHHENRENACLHLCIWHFFTVSLLKHQSQILTLDRTYHWEKLYSPLYTPFPPLWLMVNNLLAVQETQEMWVRSLGWEDPLEEGMATYSSIVHGVAKSQTWLKWLCRVWAHIHMYISWKTNKLEQACILEDFKIYLPFPHSPITNIWKLLWRLV